VDDIDVGADPIDDEQFPVGVGLSAMMHGLAEFTEGGSATDWPMGAPPPFAGVCHDAGGRHKMMSRCMTS
jgi:hypothetical protein